MVEPRFHEGAEPRFVKRQPGGNQADVKARRPSGAHQFDKVGPGERLAASEIGLEHTGIRSFPKNARPLCSGEFIAASLQFERIGTVDAMQGAAVRQFGDESEGI